MATGIRVCANVSDQSTFESVQVQIRNERGPFFFNIKIRAEELPLVLPPKDGVVLKQRFRRALLGADTDA